MSTYEFKIDIEDLLQRSNIAIDAYQFQKMVIIYNAVNDGWTVLKTGQNYVFRKAHNGQQEIFNEKYLERFIQQMSSK